MNIRQTTFDGYDAVELNTSQLRLVIVTAFGPRIAFFGRPDGANLLLWEPGKYTRDEWDLRGGHRVWVARPDADESEDTYTPDNAPCEVRILDNSVWVMGAESPVNRTRRGIQVSVAAEDRVEVDNILVNSGNMLYSGSVWALTCTLPTAGTRYAVTIGDGSDWDLFNMVMFKRWAGHGQGGFADAQITVTDDLVIVEPQGRENKRMLKSHTGIIAMSDRVNDLTFGKKTGFEPGSQYPLDTNIAFYIGPDNFMVEMETMGPSKPLKPGDELHHVESWVLRPGAASFDGAGELTALFE
jgi:hypothetical protein